MISGGWLVAIFTAVAVAAMLTATVDRIVDRRRGNDNPRPQ
jgi:hypothetical protein